MRFALFVIALLFVTAGCMGKGGEQAGAKEWPTKLVSVQQFLEKFSSPPPMNAQGQQLWRQVVATSYMELARLSQAGADVSMVRKPRDKADLLRIIEEELPGKEYHKAALAFWLAQEDNPGEILYGAGIFENELRLTRTPLRYILTDLKERSLGYFTEPETEENRFIMFLAVRWDPRSNEFLLGINEKAIREFEYPLFPAPPD